MVGAQTPYGAMARGVVASNGRSSVLGIARSGKAFIIERSKSGQVGEIRMSVMTMARCFSRWTFRGRGFPH
jgi:hypothetical protein